MLTATAAPSNKDSAAVFDVECQAMEIESSTNILSGLGAEGGSKVEKVNLIQPIWLPNHH
ncbi:hypothetical protein PGRAT_22360 [Paenibacillus graminis]|uniref:Uncharacterized protein n=1 Tax=Paenibacillus graminis TaxID=189425 RepID=A0A089M8G1_9BACL|nr:hypothetical protein PGRAT_22360 [Paenibacillus graminis]